MRAPGPELEPAAAAAAAAAEPPNLGPTLPLFGAGPGAVATLKPAARVRRPPRSLLAKLPVWGHGVLASDGEMMGGNWGTYV